MRGKEGIRDGSGETSGITPAYAGKSTRCDRQSLHGRDHPRLCGEKLNFLSVSF